MTIIGQLQTLNKQMLKQYAAALRYFVRYHFDMSSRSPFEVKVMQTVNQIWRTVVTIAVLSLKEFYI